jgi:hypothetical protein
MRHLPEVCGSGEHPEARVDCAMAHALQCTIETGGSIHRTVGAVAMVRSRLFVTLCRGISQLGFSIGSWVFRHLSSGE